MNPSLIIPVSVPIKKKTISDVENLKWPQIMPKDQTQRSGFVSQSHKVNDIIHPPQPKLI